jgi:hypothetical protein
MNPTDSTILSHWPQSAIDEAVALWEQLLSFARTPAARTNRERELEALRILMATAAQQAPDTLHQIQTLRGAIQHEGEADDAALLVLFELLPYLVGAKGPYAMEYHYQGKPVAHVRMNGDTFDIRDADGVELPHEEVFVVLRRRAPAELVQPVPGSVDA